MVKMAKHQRATVRELRKAVTKVKRTELRLTQVHVVVYEGWVYGFNNDGSMLWWRRLEAPS